MSAPGSRAEAASRDGDDPGRDGHREAADREGADLAAAEDSRGWLRRLTGFVLVHRRDATISFGAAVLGSLCQVVVPLLERQIVDDVIVARSSALWPWLLAAAAHRGGPFGFAYLRRYHGGRVALAVQNDLRNAMHAHLQRMDFAARPDADRPARRPRELRRRAGAGPAELPAADERQPAADAAVAGGDVHALAAAGPGEPGRRAGAVRGVVPDAHRGLPGHLGRPAARGRRAGSSTRTSTASGSSRRSARRAASSTGWRAPRQSLYGSQMRAVRLQARYQPLLQAIPTLAQVAVLALGGWLALRGQITLGTFLAFSTYVGQLVAPARQLAGVLTVGQQARAGVERIFAAARPEPRRSPTRPSARDARAASRGELELRRRALRLRRGRPAADRLRPARGGRASGSPLVGPSGSGKSTRSTCSLAASTTRTAGAVLVDGHDLRDVTLRLPARPGRRASSRRASCSPTRSRPTSRTAAPTPPTTRSRPPRGSPPADDFVAALPHGYDTVVGERGLTPLRRPAPADRAGPRRARGPADPAPRRRDQRGRRRAPRRRIHDALRTRARGPDHPARRAPPSTLHLADRVVVLDDGRVVDEGTHEELLARSAAYRALLTGLGRRTHGRADGRRGDATGATSARTPGAAAAGRATGRDRLRTGAVGAARGRQRPGPGARSAASTARAWAGGSGTAAAAGGWAWPADARAARPGRRAAARSATSPPVDLDARPPGRRGFTLRGLLREFRRPLLLGLVAGRARRARRARRAGPGQDRDRRRRRRRARRRCCSPPPAASCSSRWPRSSTRSGRPS